MTLYVNSAGEVSPIYPPPSRIGPEGASILGYEVTGFVTLEAERGLRAMLWPDMQRRKLCPRLTEAKG